MKTKSLGAALFAACMLLAVMAPAVAAADYPRNAQFMVQHDPAALGNASEQLSGTPGTLYVNPDTEATTTSKALQPILRTTTRSDNWPQFHYDAAHTGLSPTTGLTTSNSSAYRKILNKALSSTNPLIANGYVYVLTNYTGMWEPDKLPSINLTCLRESDLSIQWQFPLPRKVHYGSWSSPAVDLDSDTVFVSSDFQHFAINATSGKERWNYTSKDVNVNGGPSIGGGNVYFSDWGDGGVGGDYYSLNKTTKVVNWIFNNTRTLNYDMAYAQGSPAYDSTDDSVYVTGWTYSGANGTGSRGYLYKVNSTGYEVWSVISDITMNFCGSAAVGSDTVYVASYNFSGWSKLYAYNKTDGSLRWSNWTEDTDGTPALANGLVYTSGGTIGYSTPGVRAFNASTGVLVWSNTSAGYGGWTDSVSVANGYAFAGREYPEFGSYTGFAAFNATTGIISWYHPKGGSTAGIANSKAYTIGYDGYLYRF